MRWSILVIILLLAMMGCGRSLEAPGGASPLAESAAPAKQRQDALAVPASDTAELVGGNSAFAFDLYHAISQDRDNLFYSPYSISLALAMTYAGARGETERQMAETLRLTLDQERLHPAFNALDLELANRAKASAGQEESRFRLNVVNALWGQAGQEFLPEFLDVLVENYGAGLRLLDFASAPEASRAAINEWVSEQTASKITNLIPPGVIDSLTRLVLTNAIYFSASWQHPFREALTVDGAFRLLDGSAITVPMMKQTESFGYAEGPNYQAVELPYDGRELAMVILLPEAGTLQTFENSLDARQVNAVIGDLTYRSVALTLPRFGFDFDLGLADTLRAMGMPDAFAEEADFSGMNDARGLYIKDVIHKAFVSVDEAGTEAAAATAVVMAEDSVPEQPVEVTVDRPFVFLIRDIETDTLLFVGRVVNPSNLQDQ